MNYEPGKYTIDLFAEKYNLTRQSAINLLSKLKDKGYVSVEGGGKQKRIYTISKLPKKKQNGFYYTVNKYSSEKLFPKFEHYVYGRYTIEHAIIDGLLIGDKRTLDAVINLFRHVKDWKKLFLFAKKKGLEQRLIELYNYAKTKTKVKSIPKRYL
jgi:DNA-binding transcriptional regulator LsrR (DeoR family)